MSESATLDSHRVPAPPTQTAHVLLVEDDPLVLRATRRILESLGCRVVACATAERALLALRHDHFDVVVSDICMKGIDGVELLRRARALGATVPFVLVSGVPDSVRPMEGIAAGAYSYMTKPVAPDLLEATLAKLVPGAFRAEG